MFLGCKKTLIYFNIEFIDFKQRDPLLKYRIMWLINSKFYCGYECAKFDRRWPPSSACQDPQTVKEGVGTDFFIQLIRYRLSENYWTWQTHKFLNSFHLQIFSWKVWIQTFQSFPLKISLFFNTHVHTTWLFIWLFDALFKFIHKLGEYSVFVEQLILL